MGHKFDRECELQALDNELNEMTEREQWAEDHGYYHWKCRDCGRSGWTDTTPDCDCRNEEEKEEE